MRTYNGMTRRQLLATSGMGFGTLALNWLLSSDSRAVANSLDLTSLGVSPRPAPLPARAKSVIMLLQSGGPSHMDLFDPKPALTKFEGTVHREKVEMFQNGSESNKLLAPAFKFSKHGQCGMDIAEPLPHMAKLADEMCMVRSMNTGHNNHTEALVMITSGKIFPGRPTLGAWISYGLGTENQNLPAFVVLRDPDGYPGTGATLWQNGWLPAVYQGTEFNAKGPAVLDLQPAVNQLAGAQTDDRAFLAKLNERHRKLYPRESALDARIRNYELAARMQLAAGDALDISKETAQTRAMYGLDNPTTSGYGTRCLMARRLVEQGVRFVQVFPGVGNPWDSHTNSKDEIGKIASITDQPTAALIHDLKQRGLLDETIVLWTGEFGRLPVSQNGKGRDHNRNGFTLLLSGGGFKRGCIHGATDDVGYRAVENPVSVPDLFATILAQLGLDHTKLIYEHHGRPETLTDAVVTSARVVNEILA